MLALSLDRAIDYMSSLCIWEPAASEIKHTFGRFALPITWDYAEGNLLGPADRLFAGGVSNVGRVLDSIKLTQNTESARVLCQSAIVSAEPHDLIVTDPPYYDAIPYSDLMDFFYVWLRRSVSGFSPEVEAVFSDLLDPNGTTRRMTAS